MALGVAVLMVLVGSSTDAGADPPGPRLQNLQVLPEDADAGEVFRVMKLMTHAPFCLTTPGTSAGFAHS